MPNITYADKSASNTNSGVADVNKVNAADMNEIKNVVNDTILQTLMGTSGNSWSSSKTYSKNDFVTYDYKIYKNATGTNTATNPASDNNNWVPFTLYNYASIYGTILPQFQENGTIMWTNQNPGSSITSNTNITLNVPIGGYDLIVWVVRLSTNNNYTISQISYKGYGTRIYGGTIYRNITRNSDSSFTIETVNDSSNQNFIPLYAIGYQL